MIAQDAKLFKAIQETRSNYQNLRMIAAPIFLLSWFGPLVEEITHEKGSARPLLLLGCFATVLTSGVICFDAFISSNDPYTLLKDNIDKDDKLHADNDALKRECRYILNNIINNE